MTAIFRNPVWTAIILASVLVMVVVGAVVSTYMLQVERSNFVNIHEHREFNQMDHDGVCNYLRDAAVAAGRPVYPCGSESHETP